MTDLLILFLIFGLIVIQLTWVITEPRKLKDIFTPKNAPTYAITALTEILVIIPQLISGKYFPINLGVFNNVVIFAGICMYLFGIIFSIWAKLTMKRNWGVPAQHDIQRQTRLVTNGPYKYSRNPIYVGLIAIAFGFSLALRSYFFFLPILLIIYFDKAIKKEELYLDK